jgi:hypothetical protein
MTPNRWVLIVLACTFPLDAQIAATINRTSSGSDEVRIRNDSASSLVAFVAAVKQSGLNSNASRAPLLLYADPLIDGAITPIKSGEDRLVLVNGFRDPSGKPRPWQEPVLAAGIFEDGTIAGDGTLLMRLMFRRSNMLLAIETALEIIMDAGKRNILREQLIRQFTRMADLMNRGYLSPEQQIGRGLYQSIAGKLLNLPPPEVGAPFPPSAFVEREAAMLNRQRVRLLESVPSLIDGAFIEGRLHPGLAPRAPK